MRHLPRKQMSHVGETDGPGAISFETAFSRAAWIVEMERALAKASALLDEVRLGTDNMDNSHKAKAPLNKLGEIVVAVCEGVSAVGNQLELQPDTAVVMQMLESQQEEIKALKAKVSEMSAAASPRGKVEVVKFFPEVEGVTGAYGAPPTGMSKDEEYKRGSKALGITTMTKIDNVNVAVKLIHQLTQYAKTNAGNLPYRWYDVLSADVHQLLERSAAVQKKPMPSPKTEMGVFEALKDYVAAAGPNLSEALKSVKVFEHLKEGGTIFHLQMNLKEMTDSWLMALKSATSESKAEPMAKSHSVYSLLARLPQQLQMQLRSTLHLPSMDIVDTMSAETVILEIVKQAESMFKSDTYRHIFFAKVSQGGGGGGASETPASTPHKGTLAVKKTEHSKGTSPNETEKEGSGKNEAEAKDSGDNKPKDAPGTSVITCYNCGKLGHYTTSCREPRICKYWREEGKCPKEDCVYKDSHIAKYKKLTPKA